MNENPDIDEAYEPFDMERARRQQSAYQMVNSVDADPEKAARALQLSKISNTDPSLILPDMEHFESQEKIKNNNRILADNKFIQQYIAANPLHAQLSNDDYGELDDLSHSLGKLSLTGSRAEQLFRMPEAIGGSIFDAAAKGFKQGFTTAPPGSWLSDKDIKENRLAAATAATIGMPLEGVLRLGAGILEASKEAIKEGSKTAYHQITGDEQGAEQFSRDLSSMVEQYMMGTAGAHFESTPTTMPALSPRFSKAAEKALPILQRARPWLDEGREPPVGLDPEIDKLKFEQNKLDLGNLDEAFKKAQSTATGERSQEVLATFIHEHGDASIGISGDAVAKLYGDKVPETGDGILGFVPDIASKLQTAIATGGDVHIPLADWLSKADPEVAKLLHDDTRVRPGGITKNEHTLAAEARKETESKPAEVLPDPFPAFRATTGLEPLFSQGDRKLELKKRPHDESGPDRFSGVDMADGKYVYPDHYNFHDENGKAVGFLDVLPLEQGTKLYVANTGMSNSARPANSIGPSLTRDIARQLKEQYPEATHIGGYRISGARDAANKPDRMMWIKFDDLEGPKGWGEIEGFTSILKINATRTPAGKGGILRYNPEMGIDEAAADKLVRETLARIAPDAQVFTPTKIDVPDKPPEFRRGGFMQPHFKQNPWIVVALDSVAWDREAPNGVARHEAIHYLKQFGFFSEGEWATLERAAREQDWLKKFGIEERYSKLDMRQKLEEAIAEGYRNWAEGRDTPKALNPIFQKLHDLFVQLREGMRELLGGKEPDWKEIFQMTEFGEVGRREPRGHEKGAFLETTDRSFDPSASDEAKPAFDSAAAAGMTKPQFERYMQLIQERHKADLATSMAKAEKLQAKKLTAEWKAERVNVRTQVAEDITNRPDVAADLFFGAGELYGSKISNRIKIGEEFVTPEQKARLPKDYLSKKGVNPDDFSSLFGYGSGKAMIDRLAEYNEPKMQANMGAKDYVKRVTDLETDRQMELRHGSLEKNILQEASDQALSENQVDLLHEETMALAMKAKAEFPVTKGDIKKWAVEQAKTDPIGSMDVEHFYASMGRAGKAAEMALLKGDYAEAFRAKQQQYRATVMAIEAKKLQKEIGSFDKLAKRLSARDLPTLEPSYVPYIHQILQQIGKPIRRSVQDLQAALDYQGKTLEEFVEFKEQHDLREIPVAAFLIDDPNFKKEFQTLTVEEFRAVRDSITALQHNARDELKIERAGEAAELKTIKERMVQELRTFKEKHYDAAGGRWLLGVIPPRLAKAIRTYAASHLQLESLFNRFDRGDPRGVFSQYVMRDLVAAANEEAAMEKVYSTKLKEIAKGDKAKLNEKIDNPIFKNPLSTTGGDEGYLMQFTRKHLRAVMLNMGNESNLAKLAKGYNLHRDQIKQWVDSHAEKADWDWAQKMWDTFDDIKKQSDTMYRSVSGVEPAGIDIQPIHTPHGEYRGGYYPVIYHPVFEGASRSLMGGEALEQNNFHRATTPAGYIKERTKYAAPMSLELDMLPVRMRQMLHDIAMRPAILNAGKIFYDKDVRAAIAKHYGAEYREMLVPYLKDVANSANFRDDASWVGANALEFVRQNMIATLIGLNPGTVMKHGPTAAINSMTEVGIKDFAKAVSGLLSVNEQTGESNWRFAMEASQELQRRHRHFNETLSGATEKLVPTSRFDTLRNTLIKFSSTPVAISDLLSAVPTWLAKYESAMAEHGVHGDAVFEADRAVRRAHGSTAITNRSKVMRTGPMGAWLASVYGFFNHIMNRQYELMWKAGDTLGKVKDGDFKGAMKMTPELTIGLFSYVLLPALIEEMVTPLATDDKESWGKKAAKGLAYTLSASWIGVRDIASALLRGQDPAIGLFTAAGKTITDIGKDLSKDKPLSPQNAGRVIQHGATVIGATTGLMNAQMGKSARFAHDVAEGKAKPKGPWGWMVGMRHGTLDNHSKTLDEWLTHH